ncbi:helix-turn-helix domain-containing protein [Bacillus toyonensis]|uniref:DNA-binding protein n=1 Tax=Bacillus toyonensis TaxID=155322 RepID=A0A2C4RBP7_9BACI|nr:helix-turn-helix domain-containing protein [Bacillus toyonensis]PGB04637.1 DNA-binding protein [Bacillus toyonensis]PHD74223.1 DNA-binding protein [Bacillus toyonensis]
MNNFKQQSIFTNNTDFYILVGNYNDILSYHKTLNTATVALKSILKSDNTWPSIWIMAPGETCLGPYIKAIPEENSNTSYDSLKNIIGVEEAAKFLGRSSQTVKNMCTAGKLPAKKIEGKWALNKTMLKFLK